MDKKLRTAVLINFTEYNLLLKKSELYDKLISKNSQTQQGSGPSLPQILAKEAFNEGLLNPSPKKSSNRNIFFFLFVNFNFHSTN